MAVTTEETSVGTDRVALVTGASRGIGLAISEQLLARGLRVVGTHVRPVADDSELAVALREHSGRMVATPFELGSTESAHSAVTETIDQFERLDTLIANAGIWHGGFLQDVDPDRWWSVVESNVRGNVELVRAALPALLRGSSPSITFVSSVVGEIGFTGDTAYAGSKAALVGVARSLAKELARSGVRVNVVQPGFVETEMTDHVPDRSREHILRQTLMRRFGTPDEIATAATFLSEDATFATGTVLTIDGGWSI